MQNPICQTCGRENAADAEFCANRACGAFLGWQSGAPAPTMPEALPPIAPPQPVPPKPAVQPHLASAPGANAPTAPAARPRAPVAAGPTQRVSARLENDYVRIEPGGKGELALIVRNAGTVVEQFVLAVTGVPKNWVTVNPPRVNLDVDAQERCQITVRPPREAMTPMGRTPLAITITSSIDNSVISTLDATVDVDGFTVLESSLAPFESEGTRGGEHQLIVTNDGNQTTNVNFAATDTADKLRVSFDPPSAALQPAQQAYVRVSVVPRRRTWFAAPKRHAFSVSVTPPSGNPTQLNASLNQLARFPHWVPKAGAALLAVLLAVGVPLAIRELNKSDRASEANALVKIPQVTGISFDQAVTQLQAAGFLVEKAPEAVSQGERDKVFAQDPVAGTPLRKRSVVKLTMSAGPGRAAIADVQAYSAEDGKRTLEALGIKVTTGAQAVQNRDVAQGLVVRTNPPAGTQVDVGATVELVLSDGPPPKPLPPTTGEYTDVTKQLVAAGFAVASPPKNTKTADKKLMGTVAACTVTETATPCAAKEKEGSTLLLAVYVLNETVGVPDLAASDQAAATQALTAVDLRVGAVTKKPSATAPIGTVVETVPAKGVAANRGATVDIVLSGGPPVAVPNLTGLPIGTAKSRLATVGLSATAGVCKDTENVATQTPAAAAQVSKGDVVGLNCSRCAVSICVEVQAIAKTNVLKVPAR